MVTQLTHLMANHWDGENTSSDGVPQVSTLFRISISTLVKKNQKNYVLVDCQHKHLKCC